jgi:hypothetical protein
MVPGYVCIVTQVMRTHGLRGWQVYAGFAVFGGFWGSWGASIPAIRDQAGVSNGQLGTALLFVGAGALPAMLLAGQAVDRWGARATAVFLPLLGAVGIAVTLTARDMTSLCAGLLGVGVSSGAADVAINTAAGSAEKVSGRPVIVRAHATFSAAVVVMSLGAGALHGVGLPTVVAFTLVGVSTAGATTALVRTGGAVSHRRGGQAARGLWRLPISPAVAIVLGGLGALAFAIENSHQSWSALYLRDILGAGPAAAATGPALFAGVVAVTRLTAGSLGARHPVTTVVSGSAAAALGTAVLGGAQSVATGWLGLTLAAVGTAVLFPTVLSVLTTRVPDPVRGAATSIVSTVAYLGFLAGPVYVGRWADAVHLPGAMFAVAGLGAVMVVLSAATLPRLTRSGADQHAMHGADLPCEGAVDAR